jgi:hypothetical protein
MQEAHTIDLSYQLTLVISLVKTTFWKGNSILDTNAKLIVLTSYFSQTELVKLFLQSKAQVF